MDRFSAVAVRLLILLAAAMLGWVVGAFAGAFVGVLLDIVLIGQRPAGPGVDAFTYAWTTGLIGGAVGSSLAIVWAGIALRRRHTR